MESRKYQDNGNIYCQLFPDTASEKQYVNADYDGYHCHHVMYYSYLSTRFSQPSPDDLYWNGYWNFLVRQRPSCGRPD